MVDLVYCLTSSLFFDIPLLYYHSKLRSSIIFYLCSGEIYIFLGISLSGSIFSVSFLTVSELLCDDFLETFVILSANLLPIESPVASAAFRIALFEAVLSASAADHLA